MLEKVVTGGEGRGFKSLCQAQPLPLCLLLVDQIQVFRYCSSVRPAYLLRALTLRNVNQLPEKLFLLKVALVLMSLYHNRKVAKTVEMLGGKGVGLNIVGNKGVAQRWGTDHFY